MTNTNTTDQQPTTMWEIKPHGPKRMVLVEVLKQTEKTVWIKRLKSYGIGKGEEYTTEQCRKDSRFYDTWESAYDFILNQARQNVEREKRNLNAARSRLGEIEKMKPPIIAFEYHLKIEPSP